MDIKHIERQYTIEGKKYEEYIIVADITETPYIQNTFGDIVKKAYLQMGYGLDKTKLFSETKRAKQYIQKTPIENICYGDTDAMILLFINGKQVIIDNSEWGRAEEYKGELPELTGEQL